jgi:hypothetical protein
MKELSRRRKEKSAQKLRVSKGGVESGRDDFTIHLLYQ